MPQRPIARILMWVTALAFLAHAPTSEATTRLEITVLGGAGASAAGGDGQHYFETVSSTEAPFSYGESANSPDGSSDASGSVGFGWARSLATASHSAPAEANGGSSASTQSLFRDDLTITAPGATGGGSVIFRIDVSGGLAAATAAETSSMSADADWSTFARASTAPAEAGRIAEGHLFKSQSGVFPTGDLMGGVYEWGPIPFTFGVPFEITIAMNAEVDVNRCCSATANFESSWEGVVEIRDGEGMLVPDFSISSGSGANYGESIPVPEPAVGALALASLMAIGLVARAGFSARPQRSSASRKHREAPGMEPLELLATCVRSDRRQP